MMATLKLDKPSFRQLQRAPARQGFKREVYTHVPTQEPVSTGVIPVREDGFELVDIELKNWGWWMANLQGVNVGYNAVSVGFENAGVSYVDHEDDVALRESVAEQSRPDDERAIRCDQLIQRVCSQRDKACLIQRFVYQNSAREGALTLSRKRDSKTGEQVWKCGHNKYLEWLGQAKAKLDTAYRLTS